MNSFLRIIRLLIPILLITGLVSCFKQKFPVVGPPNDVKGDSLVNAPANPNVQQKVLIIGIDGCRGDAMQIANAPNIHGLLPHAIYSFDALTQAPTLSGPGWSSMLTGVWSDKHGVKDNKFSGNNFAQYPMVFKYLKQINPNLRTVSICSWDPLNQYLVSNADVKISTNENDVAVEDSAIAHLKNDNPDIMFLHFDDVDEAGHQYGFDTTVSQYMQAITTVDGYVGNILQALNSRPNIANENWLIIISTDHGGIGKSHGGDTYQERNIFTIFYNKNFTSKEITPPPNTLKAVSFQNVGEYAYSTDPLYNFDSLQQFSVQMQIKAPAQLFSDIPFMTNKDWSGGADVGWGIFIHGQSWKFNAGDGNNRVDANANAPALSDGQWHTITLTLDRNGNASMYQDGKLYNNTSMVGIATLNPQQTYKLVLADDVTGFYKYYNGDPVFDEANVRIWDTVLDPKYIANEQSCDTIISQSDPYYNNLIGFWRGTDGSGNVWKDYSKEHADMQIHQGAVWEQQQIDFCNTPLPPSVPTIVDIVPSIFGWFHINIDPAWGLDGISWLPQ